MIANAVLHVGMERNETLPRFEPIQLEKEILSLLRVLRALIQGAPSKTSAAPGTVIERNQLSAKMEKR